MLERQWKTLSGEKISNIVDALSQALEGGKKDIHIGSDSQQCGKFTEYVTVLTILTPGKGGRVFYVQEKVPRIKSLRERLYKEVWMSTELAMELSATPDIGGRSLTDGCEMTIHIDANPNVKFKSSAYAQELAGMAVSQGFRTLLKPESWAASHTADHVVKHKVIGR